LASLTQLSADEVMQQPPRDPTACGAWSTALVVGRKQQPASVGCRLPAPTGRERRDHRRPRDAWGAGVEGSGRCPGVRDRSL